MREDRLVIRDVPVALWLVGTGLLGLAAYQTLKGDLTTAGIVAFFGLLCLLLPTVLTITADRETKTLTLRYGLLIQRSIKHIPFHEIGTIQVDRQSTRDGSRSSQRSISYRIELIKKDGRLVPFRSYYSGGASLKKRRAEKLRAFIGLGTES